MILAELETSLLTIAKGAGEKEILRGKTFDVMLGLGK